MKIRQVIGREIFDSRGFPAVECELILEESANQIFSVRAAIPSGLSRGKHEAFELRDGQKRLFGRGVLKAVDNLQNVIGPAIIGQEPDVVQMDIKMLELDNTENKSKLGANAILAASIAILKAQAIANRLEVYELIARLCELSSVSIPIPMLNIISGGMHAPNNLDMQEFLIIPAGQTTFRSAFEDSLTVFYNLNDLLKEKGLYNCIGDEGGFAPALKNEREALDLILEAIKKSSGIEGTFVIGIDVAASRLYNQDKNNYTIHGKQYSQDALIKLYSELINNYPIVYIEDPFDQDDLETWKDFTKIFGEKIQITGDDLFTTNPEKILKGAKEKLANSAVIKPNQIGTITETLQAIIVAKENGLDTIISHRSGETNDNIVVDLAMGTQSGQIKAGGPTRGERLSKYNRLLRIEDKLTMQVLNNES